MHGFSVSVNLQDGYRKAWAAPSASNRFNTSTDGERGGTTSKSPHRKIRSSTRKIMEYTVITDVRVDGLINQVNKAIAMGWEPIGGVSGNGSGRWAQAMIRRD